MVIARPITGKYRTIKSYIRNILFAVFLILPFIRIDDIPLLLIDIPARKFFIFGLTIWPQELYFLHLLLMIAGIALFAVTALFGRIWCGYACPQTLFTEVYDIVGRFVSGNRLGKKGQLQTPIRIWVYSVWMILSLFFSIVLLAYFKPFEEIIKDIASANFFASPYSWVPAVWVVFVALSTGAAWFNMTFFRENLCKYVCPYGRFQAALLDQHSPIVSYSVLRGEPRRDRQTQKVGQHEGECINCDLCVMVCPTGIDIRDGLQIGCLSCGLCVDACTHVMAGFNLKSLIDYRTIRQATEPEAKVNYLRPRTVIYASLLFALTGVFTALLVKRVPIYANIVRDKAISNIYIPNMGWQNGYEIHVGNQSHQNLQVQIKPNGNDAHLKVIRSDDTLSIAGGGYERIRYIVQYPESAGKPDGMVLPISFTVVDINNPKHSKIIESSFTFP